jgi:hypothetical protein
MSVKQDDLPSVIAVQLRRAGELTLGTRNVRVKLGEVEPVMGVVLRQPSALRLVTDVRARTGVRPFRGGGLSGTPAEGLRLCQTTFRVQR